MNPEKPADHPQDYIEVEYPDPHLRGRDYSDDDEGPAYQDRKVWAQMPGNAWAARYAVLDQRFRSTTPSVAWVFPVILAVVVAGTGLLIQSVVSVPEGATSHVVSAANTWKMTTMLFSVLFVFTVIVSNVLIFRAGSPRASLAISVGTTVAGLVAVVIAWQLQDHTMASAPLEAQIKATAFAIPGVKEITSVLNGLAAWATFVVVAGTCSLIAHEPANARQLSNQLRASRVLIFVASGLLVTGVFAVSALYTWPAHVKTATVEAGKTTETPDPEKQRLQEIARGGTTMVGVTFTLILASTYLPLVFLQRERAYRLIRPWDRTEAWLSIHGFSLQPSQQLGRLMVILAPLIAGGPLTHLISLLPD